MINSFACSKTQLLFETGKATGFLKSIQKSAKCKLTMLYLAQELGSPKESSGVLDKLKYQGKK